MQQTTKEKIIISFSWRWLVPHIYRNKLWMLKCTMPEQSSWFRSAHKPLLWYFFLLCGCDTHFYKASRETFPHERLHSISYVHVCGVEFFHKGQIHMRGIHNIVIFCISLESINIYFMLYREHFAYTLILHYIFFRYDLLFLDFPETAFIIIRWHSLMCHPVSHI